MEYGKSYIKKFNAGGPKITKAPGDYNRLKEFIDAVERFQIDINAILGNSKNLSHLIFNEKLFDGVDKDIFRLSFISTPYGTVKLTTLDDLMKGVKSNG